MVYFFCYIHKERPYWEPNDQSIYSTSNEIDLLQIFLWEIIGGLITKQNNKKNKNKSRQKFQRRIAIICNNEESTEAVEDNVLFSSFKNTTQSISKTNFFCVRLLLWLLVNKKFNLN